MSFEARQATGMELVQSDPQSEALTKIEESPLATVSAMLKAVLAGDVTGDKVQVAKDLMALYREAAAEQSKRDFAGALAELQRRCQKVQARKPVPNNDGTVRYKYAPYEEIMDAVQPHLTDLGFAVDFSSRFDDHGRVYKICTLTHRSGHSKSNDYGVRIGSGPPKATESQADGAAHTYAKRGALCDALNIRIDHDDTDARDLGANITPEQAESIKKRVIAVNGNEKALLKFAGATSYETIPVSKLAAVDRILTKKEREQAAQAGSDHHNTAPTAENAQPAPAAALESAKGRLQAIVEQAGFTFQQFIKWAATGNPPYLRDADSIPTWQDIPEADAIRLAKAPTGLKAQLANMFPKP